ncbi:MAG: hypothetical protein HYT70_02740 [Candidatus Aenigmarchaeota archaeon]|nr:hypothetical protein [Candidatus Aenigmarchaeota archaeon]
MSNVVKTEIYNEEPGMGLNANPFEGEMYIDLTGPMGSMSGLYYGLIFQLRKVGFETLKIEEWIQVPPVFKQYYDLTIHQKEQLEAQIKAGLGQIATAIHDYDLISHDLRKYREYMDYFTKIEKGKKMMMSKKKLEKDEGEQMAKEGTQLLRSVFVDQVDAHTGEGIAIRTITPRWPTIIVDFMRLDDKDTDPKKIAQRHGFTEAEGAVLSTKNKLFMEWRDRLFKPTLQERFQNVRRLVEMRRASVRQYTEMIKPTIARYRMIDDALRTPSARGFHTRFLFPPGSQAYSLDMTRIWAFLPFAPAEKYKVTRDFFDTVTLSEAGFNKRDIEILAKNGVDVKETLPALPVERSIDDIVRRYMPNVQKTYNVEISIHDVYLARQRLSNIYRTKAMQMIGGVPRRESLPTMAGGSWPFSPYFVFLDIPFLRNVIRLPNGTELEDMMVDTITVQTRSQNVMIVTILEMIAKEKELENYIKQLLGEFGGPDLNLKSIEELVKEEYPEMFGGEEKKERKEGKDLLEPVKKVQHALGDVLSSLGLKFDVLRARGPYEFAMDDRIAEMFQVESMVQGYLYVLRYLQQGVKVPGIRI